MVGSSVLFSLPVCLLPPLLPFPFAFGCIVPVSACALEFIKLGPSRKRAHIQHPSFPHPCVAVVDHDGDARNRPLDELGLDGVDGIPDPGTHGWVSGLVHGQAIGLCAEEGGLRIERPVIEDVVDGDGEEVGEGGQQLGGLRQGYGDGLVLGLRLRLRLRL